MCLRDGLKYMFCDILAHVESPRLTTAKRPPLSSSRNARCNNRTHASAYLKRQSNESQKICRRFLAVSALRSVPASAVDITGAGATFPYPIYAKWAEAYKAKTGIGMNYQSIGSGGGIKQIQAKTVDFGATDAPLKPDELEKAGLAQFPAIIGGVVPVVNLDGIKPGEMKLNGAVLADIYLGKIKKWNDKAIADLNPGMSCLTKTLRGQGVRMARARQFLFTDYLSKVSPSGRKKSALRRQWRGRRVSAGRATKAWRRPCSASRVRSATSSTPREEEQDELHASSNKDGNFVTPDDGRFQAAAANAQWKASDGFYQVLTEQPGKDSWPITGASFILMQKSQEKPASGQDVLKFFDWALKNGQKMAEDLDYVPLPDNVVKMIAEAWKTQIKDPSGKQLWN